MIEWYWVVGICVYLFGLGIIATYAAIVAVFAGDFVSWELALFGGIAILVWPLSLVVYIVVALLGGIFWFIKWCWKLIVNINERTIK